MFSVDLVTHDHLTLEATMESTERIRRLADVWQQRRPPVTESTVVGIAPPKVTHVDPVTTILELIL